MVPQPVHRLALSCNYLCTCCPSLRGCPSAWLLLSLVACMLLHCVNVNVATAKLATRFAWRLSMSVSMSGRAVNAAAIAGAGAGAAVVAGAGAEAIECVLLNAMCTRDTHPPPAPIVAHTLTHTHTRLIQDQVMSDDMHKPDQTRPDQTRELETQLGPLALALARSDCGSIIRCHYVL